MSSKYPLYAGLSDWHSHHNVILMIDDTYISLSDGDKKDSIRLTIPEARKLRNFLDEFLPEDEKA